MKFVLTTIAGVESIAKKEIEKCDGKIEKVTDRLITFSGGIELIPRVNLWSRVGNKVYILLAEKENIRDFDSLFSLVSSISWKKYFKKNFPIMVKASSERSELFSEKTIQSITKKAIVDSLIHSQTSPLTPLQLGEGKLKSHLSDSERIGGGLKKGLKNEVFEDGSLEKMDILVLLIGDKARIMLNTSGNALHMRGYRKEAGEAPLKESLAAALVLLSGWKFKENFYDPFCGSGTIAIEALLIAKNIAPGINRKFAFENLGIVNSEVTENERLLAKKRQYSGDYKIFASDIDEEMIQIAKENAKRAGLEDEINFETSSLTSLQTSPNPLQFGEVRTKNSQSELSGTLVSNPPYGERMKVEDLKELYTDIDKIFRQNKELNGGIISSYLDFDKIILKDMYKKRKLYNGGEMCYFWKK